MKEHEHTVAFHEFDEGGGRLYEAGHVGVRYYSGTQDEKFNFCPICGVPLASFWAEIEAARAEDRRKVEIERGQEYAYRVTPPT
jgi:hypothetical protein